MCKMFLYINLFTVFFFSKLYYLHYAHVQFLIHFFFCSSLIFCLMGALSEISHNVAPWKRVALMTWSKKAPAPCSLQRALSFRFSSSTPAPVAPNQLGCCCLTSQLISMSEYTWRILQRVQSEGWINKID